MLGGRETERKPMSSSTGKWHVGTLAALATMLTAPVAAQDKAEDKYLDSLRTCQAITDNAERLACFDKAVGTIVAASDSDDLRIVDREEVRETRRKLFGFSLPDLGIFGRSKGADRDAPEEEGLDVLQTTITSVRPTGTGYILTTAEGAKWQIDNVPRRLLSPKPGQSLEIRSAALSAYFLRINGQGGVKGRRVE
jgi:hypothetical protein